MFRFKTLLTQERAVLLVELLIRQRLVADVTLETGAVHVLLFVHEVATVGRDGLLTDAAASGHLLVVALVAEDVALVTHVQVTFAATRQRLVALETAEMLVMPVGVFSDGVRSGEDQLKATTVRRDSEAAISYFVAAVTSRKLRFAVMTMTQDGSFTVEEKRKANQ